MSLLEIMGAKMAVMSQDGKVTQVIGPVVDVEFEAGELPALLTAITVTNKSLSDKEDNLVLEVAQHLGENTVRCIAMDATEGLMRHTLAKNTGSPIKVPVGKETLGRILNVIGEPIDEQGPLNAKSSLPIHRKPPEFSEQSTEV